jgi:ABC-type multidrug transport system ATPase subunit
MRNGAGKTAAVRILATLLRPDEGRASICGYDVLRDAHQVRQLIGLTGQYASVDEGLSGTNNLGTAGREVLPGHDGPGGPLAYRFRRDPRAGSRTG